VQPHHPPINPRLLTIPDFHRALGGTVGINSLRRAVREGRIRSLRIGERKRVIPSTELANWPLRETVGAS
jgi:hypothetical protein